MQHEVIEIQRSHPAAGGDVDAMLVAEVGFKWLMSGHGWLIDSTRLHTDSGYAARLLQLAMASNSAALQECATRLCKLQN